VPGVTLVVELLLLPQPASNDKLTDTRMAVHSKGTRALGTPRRFLMARIRTTKKTKQKGQTGTRVLGMRQTAGGAVEAAVVLTVTPKGTAAVAVTETGFGGLQVALEGAPVQVKLTVPVKPPVGLICRLYVAVCPAVTVVEVEPAAAAFKVNDGGGGAATLKTKASPFEPSMV